MRFASWVVRVACCASREKEDQTRSHFFFCSNLNNLCIIIKNTGQLHCIKHKDDDDDDDDDDDSKDDDDDSKDDDDSTLRTALQVDDDGTNENKVVVVVLVVVVDFQIYILFKDVIRM